MLNARAKAIGDIKISIRNLYNLMFKTQYSDPNAYDKAKSQVAILKKRLKDMAGKDNDE